MPRSVGARSVAAMKTTLSALRGPALASVASILFLACSASDTGTGGAGGAGTGATTTATGTGGGAAQCTPGETRACYSGPQGTEGVGICHGGTQACDASGAAFGACMGEQVPGTEDCDAAKTDENCNGKVNESGPSCTCGDGFLSTGEECDDGNKAAGDGCDPQCKIESVTALTLGNGQVCALFYDGKLKCWGAGTQGQLGLESATNRGDLPSQMGENLPFVNLGSGRTVKAVSAGTSHACAVLDDASVKCWGQNTSGQLGLGNTTAHGALAGTMGDALAKVSLGTGRTAVAITAGGNHACALLDDAHVKCWGENGLGQLGLGDTLPRGKLPTDMGDNLPELDFGTGNTVKAVATGFSSTCVILQSDKVKCWGASTSGELGYGDTKIRGNAPAQMGDALPFVDLGTGRTAKQIGVGNSLSCALLDDDTVKCWGNGFYGQLGQGDTANRGDAPGEMGDALPTVPLGTGKKPLSIAVGSTSVCAVLDDDTVKCWGRNLAGGLGYGDTMNRGNAPNEMGDALLAVDVGAPIAFAATGPTFTCATVKAGNVKCWGENLSGELGQGDTSARGDGPGEMGAALPFIKLLGPTW